MEGADATLALVDDKKGSEDNLALEGGDPGEEVANTSPVATTAGAATTDAAEPTERKAGRRKINIEYIEDKSRRHITFSKRKAGIMKKAYELSTLTGTQVLLLVASETGHVYTFATPKLQPLITKPEGKNLIQACLNVPDIPPNAAAQAPPGARMNEAGTGDMHLADDGDDDGKKGRKRARTGAQNVKKDEVPKPQFAPGITSVELGTFPGQNPMMAYPPVGMYSVPPMGMGMPRYQPPFQGGAYPGAPGAGGSAPSFIYPKASSMQGLALPPGQQPGGNGNQNQGPSH
eukprot:TRINITY_DN2771_c0_g1_i10.p1 TRINITY_DN2771_c0_g1~~TRINITY_DN2771_c0_g1_i10.p1  ORF type:complete len:289 (+),score=79.47 TRINITY_DN2771_c0_g1_i10:360-1226(+)